MSSPLTEAMVADLLMRERYRRNFCLPRYTPADWWECDIFEITEAGYFREYEIKLTLSDFRADAKKRADVDPIYRAVGFKNETITKHEALAAGYELGPRQFWYVAPVELGLRPLLPPWAGLIEIHESVGDWEVSCRLFEREARPAPRLHSRPCNPKVVEHARGLCYWRMHEVMHQQRQAMDPERLRQHEERRQQKERQQQETTETLARWKADDMRQKQEQAIARHLGAGMPNRRTA